MALVGEALRLRARMLRPQGTMFDLVELNGAVAQIVGCAAQIAGSAHGVAGTPRSLSGTSAGIAEAFARIAGCMAGNGKHCQPEAGRATNND